MRQILLEELILPLFLDFLLEEDPGELDPPKL